MFKPIGKFLGKNSTEYFFYRVALNKDLEKSYIVFFNNQLKSKKLKTPSFENFRA